MQIKKAIAIGMGTLLTGASLAFAGVAATDLKNVFPATGTSTLTASNSLIVVGSGVDSTDTVAGVDVAGRLGSTSTSTKSLTTTSSGVTGTEKDGVTICKSTTSTDCALDDAAGTGSAFPSGAVMTNTHFTGLKKGVISWNSNDYDYQEQVDLSGVTMSHDVTTDKVNGTLTMVVESSDIIYNYQFDKALNISSKNNLGTIASPEYTFPVNVKLMGKAFTIVGAGTSSLKILTGETGEVSATTGIKSGDYTAYATQGVSDSWAKIVLKDATGTEVATKSISEGNSYDFTAQGLTVKVTDVRAIGTTGEISGVDIVLGPIGSVEKEYDSTADVTSTGTASDKFPGTTEWGIQTSGLGSGSFPGIPKSARIQVVYKPSTTQYLKAGDKIAFPNSYGEVGFLGYNADKLAKITVAPFGGTSTYDVNSTSDIVGSDLYGLEISTDVAGSIVSSAGNSFDKAYVLFNKTFTAATYGYGQPFWIGFWDKTNSKILTNRSAVGAAQPAVMDVSNISRVEYMHGLLNAANTSFVYPFRIAYGGSGDADWYLNVTLNFTHGIQRITLGGASSGATSDVNVYFTNKTAGTPTAAPQFRLGTTSASAEDNEVTATTSGSANQPVGKKTQDVVSDGEVVLIDTNTNGGSDKFVAKVPSKRLAAKVYFGVTSATSGTNTYEAAVPVTTPLGKLTSDFTDATIKTTGKNLILVGGPCANKFVGQLMNVSGSDCLDKWIAEVGATNLAGAKDKALIKVVEDAFQTGKVALIVAGTDAKDTRNAAAKIIAGGVTGSKLVYSTATSGSQ
ncbi:MAG: S-layer protein [Candidatus Aenigmarchaeota archaeon]|nr:S-layer protein [Candidatus Aenigmarchaeota archaeon]